MGLCASSRNQNVTPNGHHPHHHHQAMQHYYSSSSTIKIIHENGKLEELKQKTKAKTIKSQNPNYFLCSSESMSIGKYVPSMQDDEDLQLGQIYFLLPLSQAYKPLALPDLCALAVKANSALKH